MRHTAYPYWGTSLSRRWQLFERGPVQGFFGFGLSEKTESDTLSVTRWDFASQLGLRFHLLANRAVGEVTLRHWSNGGIRLPNHGQDFATVMIRLNSGLFGVGNADQTHSTRHSLAIACWPPTTSARRDSHCHKRTAAGCAHARGVRVHWPTRAFIP